MTLTLPITITLTLTLTLTLTPIKVGAAHALRPEQMQGRLVVINSVAQYFPSQL